MADIYYTDVSFMPAKSNPYNGNKPYDDYWIMLKLLDNAEYLYFTGGEQTSVFQVVITKKCDEWKYRIMDFMEYEMAHDKNIIAAVPEDDLAISKREYDAHHYNDGFLRPYEQKVLVHSTTWNYWLSINNDGCLKSWNALKTQNAFNEERPIGEKLGDPYDYSDYIMFTNGGVSGEIVVSSKQKGRIDMDIDAPYQPGARLYFDAGRIANDGLLIRDGVHLKVKNELSLDKYLIWAATPDTADMDFKEATPRKFANESDKLFQEKYGIRLG